MKNETKVLSFAGIAIVAVFLASVAFAQNSTNNTGNSTSVQVPSAGNPLIGKGIAVSTADSTVFRYMSIGVRETTLANSTQTQLTGMMGFAGEKLALSNIAVSGTTVTADIQRNGTTVGSVSLTPATDAGHWTGSVTLDGTTYNAYIFSFQFGLKSMGKHLGQMGQALERDGKMMAGFAKHGFK